MGGSNVELVYQALIKCAVSSQSAVGAYICGWEEPPIPQPTTLIPLHATAAMSQT
jgi:hypothetical protein